MSQTDYKDLAKDLCGLVGTCQGVISVIEVMLRSGVESKEVLEYLSQKSDLIRVEQRRILDEHFQNVIVVNPL